MLEGLGLRILAGLIKHCGETFSECIWPLKSELLHAQPREEKRTRSQCEQYLGFSGLMFIVTICDLATGLLAEVGCRWPGYCVWWLLETRTLARCSAEGR